jgi:hypothetical protein
MIPGYGGCAVQTAANGGRTLARCGALRNQRFGKAWVLEFGVLLRQSSDEFCGAF